MWRLVKWIMLPLIVFAALIFSQRSILERKEMMTMESISAGELSIPAIDVSVTDHFETATFAMG